MRLLLLLEQEEFSVAELAAITQLAQPRVSTHLAKLREAHLVSDRRDGVSVYYRTPTKFSDAAVKAFWLTIREHTHDPLLEQDQQRISQVLAARARDHSWADSVAGDMERHYSPGRTWEATARGLVHLLDLGDVLDVASGDGVLAELWRPKSSDWSASTFLKKLWRQDKNACQRILMWNSDRAICTPCPCQRPVSIPYCCCMP